MAVAASHVRNISCNHQGMQETYNAELPTSSLAEVLNTGIPIKIMALQQVCSQSQSSQGL